MPQVKTILPAVFLRIICAAALILLSFAHQPVFTSQAVTIADDFSSYRLPDGTVPVICATSPYKLGDKDGNQPHYNFNNSCEACRISSSFLCPEPSVSSGPKLVPVLAYSPIQSLPQFRRNVFPPSAPPQAPPLIL